MSGILNINIKRTLDLFWPASGMFVIDFVLSISFQRLSEFLVRKVLRVFLTFFQGKRQKISYHWQNAVLFAFEIKSNCSYSSVQDLFKWIEVIEKKKPPCNKYSSPLSLSLAYPTFLLNFLFMTLTWNWAFSNHGKQPAFKKTPMYPRETKSLCFELGFPFEMSIDM